MSRIDAQRCGKNDPPHGAHPLKAIRGSDQRTAIAIALVGAIVGELPTGAVAGLGARFLAGSYYGQTVQIWSALVTAAILAGLLVTAIGLLSNWINRRMGVRP